MIRVEEALANCLALCAPLGTVSIPLEAAGGRVLAEPVIATRPQPPFAASAMDGYAVPGGSVAPGAVFDVVGEAPAGHAWPGNLRAGQALRIFTGAPIPDGADHVVIQEDISREGDRITVGPKVGAGRNVRPAGGDFQPGDQLSAPRRLGAADIALAASMGAARLTVYKQPDVALLATGDELVPPGVTPRPDQIIASNTYGLAALVQAEGGLPRILPIAHDDRESLAACFGMASDADVVVTIGGASVGDHDLVAEVGGTLGLERAFYKIAMRPGKPLLAGRMGRAAMLGLPGNPVSSLICAHLFLRPMLAVLQGLSPAPVPRRAALLTQPIPANGPREHYMRAKLSDPSRVTPEIAPLDSQDSSLLSRLVAADALLIREIDAPAAAVGDVVEYIPLTA